MTKKHWIMIKRGLSEDPKHRERMGDLLWLYLHILDRTDWETGIVYGWRDAEEAIDMKMQPRTLRDQRQRLQNLGYITCKQERRGQRIVVHNWSNPKNYSGEVLNCRVTPGVSPLLSKGDTEGAENTSSFRELTIKRSWIMDHGSERSAAAPRRAPKSAPEVHPALLVYREVTGHYPHSAVADQVITAVNGKSAEVLTPFYAEWCSRGYNSNSIKWCTEWAATGTIPPQGANGRKPNVSANNPAGRPKLADPPPEQLARDRAIRAARDNRKS